MTHKPWTEANMTINGYGLTTAQAMTIRVAIESFALSLADGLGDDEHGRRMTAAYTEAIHAIRTFMYKAD